MERAKEILICLLAVVLIGCSTVFPHTTELLEDHGIPVVEIGLTLTMDAYEMVRFLFQLIFGF